MSAISRVAYFAAIKHPLALAGIGATTAAAGYGARSALGEREGTGRSIAIDSLALAGTIGVLAAGVGAMHLDPFTRLGIQHHHGLAFLMGGVAAGSAAAAVGDLIGRAV